MTASDGWFRRRDDGIHLFVRLTPRAGADAIDGVRTDAAGRPSLAVRVRAVPEKGAANAALERLVAERLRIPPSTVAVVAGHASRLKTVALAGDPCELVASVAELGGNT